MPANSCKIVKKAKPLDKQWEMLDIWLYRSVMKPSIYIAWRTHLMANQPEKESWVYVAVENPGGNENFVGLADDQSGIAYIPAFLSKDEAQACFINMPREPGKKYEIQAVIFEDLVRDAAANGFLIFILDKEGKILNKIDPAEIQGDSQ